MKRILPLVIVWSTLALGCNFTPRHGEALTAKKDGEDGESRGSAPRVIAAPYPTKDEIAVVARRVTDFLSATHDRGAIENGLREMGATFVSGAAVSQAEALLVIYDHDGCTVTVHAVLRFDDSNQLKDSDVETVSLSE